MRKVNNRLSLLTTVSIVVILLAFSGCGDGRPKRVQVSGKISIDGKPVTMGNIQFLPKLGGRPSNGKIQSDGSYFLQTYDAKDGCIPGEYTVSISSVEYINDETRKWFLPKKYSTPTSSQLEQSITGATDSMNFELTWNGAPGPFVEKTN